jgi:hypothetical protein
VEQPPYALMPRRPCELPPVGAVAPLPGGPRKLRGQGGVGARSASCTGPNPCEAPRSRDTFHPTAAGGFARSRSRASSGSTTFGTRRPPCCSRRASRSRRCRRSCATRTRPSRPRSTATSTSTTCARALTGSRSSRRGRCSSWRRSCRRTAPDGGFWVQLLLRCCQSARGRKTKPPEAPLSRVHPGASIVGATGFEPAITCTPTAEPRLSTERQGAHRMLSAWDSWLGIRAQDAKRSTASTGSSRRGAREVRRGRGRPTEPGL